MTLEAHCVRAHICLDTLFATIIGTVTSPPVGLFSTTLLVAGSMTGVSLFALPTSLRAFGAYSWIGWIICAFCAISLAQVFGKLAEAFPSSGGPYGYVREIYGPRAGLFTGLVHLTSIIIQLGSIGHVMFEHASSLFGGYGWINSSTLLWIPLLLCTVSNLYGFVISSRLITALNLAKYFLVGLFLFAGLPHLNPARCLQTSSTMGSFGGICGAVSLIIYAVSGMEYGSITDTSKIADPEKTIPRALTLGTFIAIGVFMLVQAVVWSVIEEETTGVPLTKAAFQVLGEEGAYLLSTFGGLCAWLALDVSLFIATHLIFAMSKKGDLPPLLSCLNHYGTPSLALWLAALFSMLTTVTLFHGMSGYNQLFNFIIKISDLMLALVFLFAVLAYRKLPKQTDRSFLWALLSSLLFLLMSGVGLFHE